MRREKTTPKQPRQNFKEPHPKVSNLQQNNPRIIKINSLILPPPPPFILISNHKKNKNQNHPKKINNY